MRKFLVKAVLILSFLSFALALLLQSPFTIPKVKATQVAQYQINQSSDDCVNYTKGFLTNAYWTSTGNFTFTFYDNGLRFNNINTDNLTNNLYYVKLIFSAVQTRTGSVYTRIYGENNTNPITFSTLSDFNNRKRTSYYVEWYPSSWTQYNQYSVDITTLFNILISNSSWVSGNSIVFFWKWINGNNLRQACSYDGKSYYGVSSVILEITYGISAYYNPVARFNNTITTVNPNQNVFFNGSLSYDPDGGSLTDYSWNFGDGNTTSGAYPTITHAWNTNGNYTIGLTITDDESATDSFSWEIVVTTTTLPPISSKLSMGFILGFVLVGCVGLIFGLALGGSKRR